MFKKFYPALIALATVVAGNWVYDQYKKSQSVAS